MTGRFLYLSGNADTAGNECSQAIESMFTPLFGSAGLSLRVSAKFFSWGAFSLFGVYSGVNSRTTTSLPDIF